jgi:hypothetical protein
MSAAAALPTLFSSMNLIVEFTISKNRIPKKSSQYGGWPWICISHKTVIKAKNEKDRRKHKQNKQNKTNDNIKAGTK